MNTNLGLTISKQVKLLARSRILLLVPFGGKVSEIYNILLGN